MAEPGDVAALAELRSLWTTGSTGDAELEWRMAAWLQDDGQRRTTWLAAERGRAIGMVSLFEYRRMPRPGRPDSRWGYVGNLFVREENRSGGVGSGLLSALIAAADERGYARLVVSPSAESMSLYARCGFVEPGAPAADALLVRPGAAPRPCLD